MVTGDASEIPVRVGRYPRTRVVSGSVAPDPGSARAQQIRETPQFAQDDQQRAAEPYAPRRLPIARRNVMSTVAVPRLSIPHWHIGPHAAIRRLVGAALVLVLVA